MSFSDQDRLLALGGCFQAAWCVQGIARRGMADSAAMEAAVHSLFQTDAGDVPAVYGGAERVAPGLRQFIAQVKGNRGRDLELSRYVITLMQLERKLSGDNERLQRIASGIETAKGRLAHFHLLHPNILGQLADIRLGDGELGVLYSGDANIVADVHLALRAARAFGEDFCETETDDCHAGGKLESS